MKRLAIVVAMLVATKLARAEDVVAYPVDGEADAAGDANAARVEALDAAFGKAVQLAIDELVESSVRKANKATLDRELVGHARLWVAKFSVTKDETVDARRQLAVAVRIDRDKLRARLGELTIPTREPPSAAPPQAGPVEVQADGVAVILLRVGQPSGSGQSWGRGADPKLPGLAALAGLLRTRRNYVVAMPEGPAPAAQGDASELPLDDAAAVAVAAASKVDSVVVATVSVGEAQTMRGIPGTGALVTAQVRMLERDKRVVGQGRASAVAIGGSPNAAIDRALTEAAADVLPPSTVKLAQAQTFSGPDVPVADPGVVLLRLARATPWGLVQSELKYLAGARGVTRASIRRVSPSGWVLGVATTESIDRVAQIAKKPPTADSTVSVRVSGNIVELALSGPP